MSAKRDMVKALVRRRGFLMNKLQTEEYSGRTYDLAEYNALDYVLRSSLFPRNKKTTSEKVD